MDNGKININFTTPGVFITVQNLCYGGLAPYSLLRITARVVTTGKIIVNSRETEIRITVRFREKIEK